MNDVINEQKRKYKDGDAVEVTWSKSHRIIKTPSLGALYNTSPCGYTQANTSTCGYVVHTNEGYWLEWQDSECCDEAIIVRYAWLSTSDIVKVL